MIIQEKDDLLHIVNQCFKLNFIQIQPNFYYKFVTNKNKGWQKHLQMTPRAVYWFAAGHIT